MNHRNIPAISIVIPMYNAEKYIGECLDSILTQTFDDYEVIVVDDCSTDNSCAVVESYASKFTMGGAEKLRLIRSKVHSNGSPGVPRNTGIRVSRGEYLMFIDSDDVITNTALDELHTVADKFPADVLHRDRYYTAPGETVTTDKKLLKETKRENNFVTSPLYMSNVLEERINDIIRGNFSTVPWLQFIRRQFIAENNIEFPDLRSGEDFYFGIRILLLSKTILRIPNITYVYRKNPKSVTLDNLPVDKLIHRWSDSLFRGVKILDDLFNRINVSNASRYKYALLDKSIIYHTLKTMLLYAQIPAESLDSLIRKEMADVEDKTALSAFLFSRMSVLHVNIIKQQQLLQQQQQQIQQLQSQIQQLQQLSTRQFNLNAEDIFK